MPSVIATDNTRRSSINSKISRAMRGSARISPSSTFQSRNSSTSAFSDGTMPTVTFVARLRFVTIECNRRNRPTSQSLPGFLAQTPEESIFHDIASLSVDQCRSRAPLLDHLVGTGLQRQRHREIECVGPGARQNWQTWLSVRLNIINAAD